MLAPALTDYNRPLTSTLALLPTPWPLLCWVHPLLCRVHRLLFWVYPLSPHLVHHTIRRPFQRLCVHRLSQWIKDQVPHRPSVTSLKLCQLKSGMTSLHGLRQNRNRMKRGGSPWCITSLYIHLDHVHLNFITYRQKEEEQRNNKVSFLSHLLIHHVDSNQCYMPTEKSRGR